VAAIVILGGERGREGERYRLFSFSLFSFSLFSFSLFSFSLAVSLLPTEQRERGESTSRENSEAGRWPL
jgi:hypothetical protein